MRQFFILSYYVRRERGGLDVYINIALIILQFGPLALRWYGLMYAVAILVGLWAIRGYLRCKGITREHVYRNICGVSVGGSTS